MMCWETFEMRENKTQMWQKEKKKKQEKSPRIYLFLSFARHPEPLGSGLSVRGCPGGPIREGVSLQWLTSTLLGLRRVGGLGGAALLLCLSRLARPLPEPALHKGPLPCPHLQVKLLLCGPVQCASSPHPCGHVSPSRPWPPQFLHRQARHLTEQRAAGSELWGLALQMSPDLQGLF